MYRKDLYSNTSDSSRNGGGSWAYINGELYHFGRPGMQWGKHLPGTDWWKETYARNLANTNRHDAGKPVWSRKLSSGLKTAKLAFNINKGKLKDAIGYEVGSAVKRARNAARNAYSTVRSVSGKGYNAVKTGAGKVYNAAKTGTSKLYNAAKGYSAEKINQMRESARNHYQGVKTKVHGVLDKSYGKVSEIYNNPSLLLSSKGDNKNYLTEWVQSAAYKANGAYSNALANGPIGNMFNSFFQNGKVSAMAASAKLLDRLGLDDEVDTLIKKWSNKGKK